MDSRDSICSFCQTLYNCTYLPIHYYKDGHLQLVLPDTGFPFDLAAPHLSDLVSRKQPVSYLVTKEFHYIGLVQNTKTGQMVLIGPVISILPSPESIRNIMKEYSIPLGHREQLTELYQFTPVYSFHQFCHFLALFYQELSNDVIDIEVYLNVYTDTKSDSVASLHLSKSYDAKEMERFHNTYHYEQQYLDYIRSGNIEGLKRFFSNAFSIQAGRIADNTLRQAKNILITVVTLVTRCAIEGGLDIESAYQLSDIYIQESEKLQSAEAVYRMQYNMMMDFTRRVAQAQIPRDTTSDIYQCIQYIKQHTNQAISTSDVAAYVGKSRSYLSRCFKRELGFEMNGFIMRCKLEEAKSLLTYTDKSISEISSYLCFSSQAYFQNVFKKKFGVTPNMYRKHPDVR
ncbi:MAG: helix-turn-helix domain-containing protein [Lachnospiraceae bacterium]|nr:helix-turn-helix domain-containing protein [Lachnospiraceae bacterium]